MIKLTEMLSRMMTEKLEAQTLRAPGGRIVGRIKVSGVVATLEDADGTKLGTYDGRDNKTRDASGRTVGYGNQLGVLLVRVG